MKLLGRRVSVTASTNPDQVGIIGEVVEDGRDTLRIRTEDGSDKLLVKHTITLTLDGKVIEGKNLQGTHAARMKR